MKRIIPAVAATAVALTVTVTVAFTTTPQCTTEDSTQPVCMWDAQRQGNGRGHSFVKIGGLYVYL